MKSFAIVIVCYNRLSGVKRLLKSLERADYNNRNDITLVFSIDNSGAMEVTDFANSYEWPYGEKIVRTFPERQGLKKHILQCGDFTEKFDIVTILEDDIWVSDSFYNYAYQAANFYWDDENIAGISLYNFQKNWLDWIYRFEPQKTEFDAYFLKVAQSWGQVWTRKKWEPFREWYHNNMEFSYSDEIPNYLLKWPESSWLKYHDRYCIEQNKYFVYPYVSLSTNYSDPGEHALYAVNDHQVELQTKKSNYFFCQFTPESIIYDEYMEREGLERYLGIHNDELTVSLWGTKSKKIWRRYLLTTKVLPYKMLDSYALSLRPIEMSIIEGLKGNGIYLYDTYSSDNQSSNNSEYQLMLYSLRSHDAFRIFGFSLKLFLRETISRVTNKIRKKLK